MIKTIVIGLFFVISSVIDCFIKQWNLKPIGAFATKWSVKWQKWSRLMMFDGFIFHVLHFLSLRGAPPPHWWGTEREEVACAVFNVYVCWSRCSLSVRCEFRGRGIQNFYLLQYVFKDFLDAANHLLLSYDFSCMWLLFMFCTYMRNELKCFFYCLLNILLILLCTEIE